MIRGTSKEQLHQEKDLESLKDKIWLWRLCYLNKFLSTKLPTYLYEPIPPILNSRRINSCCRALC